MTFRCWAKHKDWAQSSLQASVWHCLIRVSSSSTTPESSSSAMPGSDIHRLPEKRWAGRTQKDGCCIITVFHSSSLAQAHDPSCNLLSHVHAACVLWGDARSQADILCAMTGGFWAVYLICLFHSWQVTSLQQPQRTLRKSDINGKTEILLPTLQILFPRPWGVLLVLGRALNSSFVGSNRLLWKCQL